jgi:lipopolysaccharide cholinephosphotransferase
MNNIKPDTLRKAQLIMLDTLIEVDKICKKHKIQYWLDFGTLLGAIRHKGFIPWDDDLDIAMGIEDYHKFCKIAEDELPYHMFLQTNETENFFPYNFAKVRNDHGIILEKHEYSKNIQYNQGIFIDIFPIMTIKNTIINKLLHSLYLLIIKLFSYKYLNIKLLSNFFIKLLDKQHLGWKENNINIVRNGRMPKLGLNIGILHIFPLKKILFENKEFYIPNNYDIYLKKLYGNNYMTLPQKEKRKTHAYDIKINYEK